jgi:hypothetical protein
VKDSQGSLVLGRTRWRRFAAVVLPATMLGVGLLVGVANGVVPVSFAISGQSFKVSADSLDGDNFSQFSGVGQTRNGTNIPLLMSVIDGEATLKNLCQSVKSSLGPSMVIRAGQGTSDVRATNLVIGMDSLAGDAEFTDIHIGKDASVVRTQTLKGSSGEFAQDAQHVHITNLKQRAYSTQAGTFKLNGLALKLSLTGEECFPDSQLP